MRLRIPAAVIPHALSALVCDPVRFGGIVAGIAFATVLIVQQLAVFLGVMEMTRAPILDADGVQVWVMDPQAEHLSPAPLRSSDTERVAGVAGVARASACMQRSVRLRGPDGRVHDAHLRGIDAETLDGLPAMMADGRREDLRRPDAVLVDAESARGRLAAGPGRPLRVGDRLEVSDRRLVVAGLVACRRNFDLRPVVFASSGLAATFVPPGPRSADLILVRVLPDRDPGRVASDIAVATGLRAMPTAEFSAMQYGWTMRNTGIPMNFAVSVALGFLVGVAIAGLLFSQFVGEQLRSLAVLRALGARRRAILAIVLIQAATAGGLGYGFGVGLAAIFHHLVQGTSLVSLFTPALLAIAWAAVAAIIAAVACLGAWRAVRVDPAAVFRQ